MNKIVENIKEHWYAYLIEMIIFVEMIVFLLFRDESYIAIHDNLDLFVSHFRMMNIYDAFTGSTKTIPMLGGISRDLFGSEFSLYNCLFMIFPPFLAYILGYFLKIFIGYGSFLLLAKDMYPDDYKKYFPIASITGLCYGLIPVFPAYSIAFTSVPLIIVLLRRLYLDDKKTPVSQMEKGVDKQGTIIYRFLLYLGVFLYPLLSYFSYHGFFILAYMCLAVVILWIRDRKFPKSIFISIIILAFGYVCFEYRLFRAMLFDTTVTIRDTMINPDLSLAMVGKGIIENLIQPVFHGQDSHLYLVLPVTVVALFIINFNYLKKKQYKKILTDSCNLIAIFIIFNCVVAAFYEYRPFREFVEMLVPQLKGFQFSRTIFFNPLLWYGMLFEICKRLYNLPKSGYKRFANGVLIIAVFVVMLEPQVYNDFYYTTYNYAYKLIKGKDTSMLNFREFYSEDLFNEVKSEIDYDGEWVVAYGMHPAVLGYNGFSILDGYLGMYSQEYKEKFEKVIEPALEQAPEFDDYFNSWGARAYIYSDEGMNTFAAYRNVDDFDTTLSINTDALRDLDCSYIISRVQITNADDLGINLRGMYKNDTSPYVIFVYSL